MKKDKTKYIGKWRIIEMEMWDQDYIDLIIPGYFSFDKDDLGYFQFGVVEGQIDYRIEKIGDRLQIIDKTAGDKLNRLDFLSVPGC